MERYTISQAAAMIGVTARILSDWIEDAQIATSAGEDKRSRYLTRQQVLHLADAHHRTVKDDPRATKLAARLAALESGLHEAQAKIAALESRLAAVESQPPSGPLQTHPEASSNALDQS